MCKRRKLALYIDGENIPAKESQKIFAEARKLGTIESAKVYGLKDDLRTRAWSHKTIGVNDFEDIRLKGKPEKNKVDNRIKADIDKDIKQHKNIDTYVIVSSDHGYVSSVNKIKEDGKRVIVIGGRQTSEKLKVACDRYINLNP